MGYSVYMFWVNTGSVIALMIYLYTFRDSAMH